MCFKGMKNSAFMAKPTNIADVEYIGSYLQFTNYFLLMLPCRKKDA